MESTTNLATALSELTVLVARQKIWSQCCVEMKNFGRNDLFGDGPDVRGGATIGIQVFVRRVRRCRVDDDVFHF